MVENIARIAVHPDAAPYPFDPFDTVTIKEFLERDEVHRNSSLLGEWIKGTGFDGRVFIISTRDEITGDFLKSLARQLRTAEVREVEIAGRFLGKEGERWRGCVGTVVDFLRDQHFNVRVRADLCL